MNNSGYKFTIKILWYSLGAIGLAVLTYELTRSALDFGELRSLNGYLVVVGIYVLFVVYAVISKSKKALLISKRLANIVSIIFTVLFGIFFLFYVTSSIKYGWGDSGEIANKPIQSLLADRGFSVECSYGDAGKGFSNLAPWREVVYRYSGTYDEAVEIVKQGAGKQGFSLKLYSEAVSQSEFSENQALNPNLNLKDKYIDVAKPKSPYRPYDKGSMRFSATIHEKGKVDVPGLWCKPQTYSLDASPENIIIETSLSLPDYRNP